MEQESKAGFIALVLEDYGRRPLWMSLIFYFCLYMTFIYMPFDMFIKPVDGWENPALPKNYKNNKKDDSGGP